MSYRPTEHIVLQDGADFELYIDTGPDATDNNPTFTWHAPAGTVRGDYDSAGATKARQLFVDFAKLHGYKFRFGGCDD